MQLFILAAIVALAAASGGHGGHGGHRGHGGHGSHGGYGHGGYGHQEYYEPRPYHFEYAVDDPHYGPMMAQTEQADAYNNKQGYYVVNLPDGRTQHVKYTADEYGYNAEVSYDGYANYPSDKHVGGGYGGHGRSHGSAHGSNSYSPSPAYH